MLLPQKDFWKWLIVYEIFAMFRFSDLEKIKQILFLIIRVLEIEMVKKIFSSIQK